jgi:dipeptidyl aminopeptidase/acylaminoacyl peptidase
LIYLLFCKIEKDHDESYQAVLEPNSIKYKALYAFNSLLDLNLDTLLVNAPIDESLLLPILFRTPQLFSFQVDGGGGCTLHGMLYMPVNYQSGHKYPTLLYVYGGPKAQLVTNTYKGNK